MQGNELGRLIMDQPTATVKVKLATGRTYNVSGVEFDVVDDEPILWIRTEPADA